MHSSNKRTIRQGRIYRFFVNGAEYGAFIWKVKSQFCGNVIGNPQVPERKGRTALAVRDALSDWMVTASTKESLA